MADAFIKHWADAEMIAEFKRLEDADCLTLDVWIGAPPVKRDASHYLPRLLELAQQGMRPSTPTLNEDKHG